MELTLEKMLEAMKILEENDIPPEHHSPEGLLRRMVFCYGTPKAVVRAWGYVYLMDDNLIEAHKINGWEAWGSIGIHDWVSEQLEEQI